MFKIDALVRYLWCPISILILLKMLVYLNDLGAGLIILFILLPIIFLIIGAQSYLFYQNFFLLTFLSVITYFVGMFYFSKDLDATIIYSIVYVIYSSFGFYTSKYIKKKLER